MKSQGALKNEARYFINYIIVLYDKKIAPNNKRGMY